MKAKASIYYIGVGRMLSLLGLLLLPTLLGGLELGATGSDSVARQAKAREYYFQAVLARQATKPHEAFDLLRHAQYLTPNDPDILYLLGQVSSDLGEGARAIDFLEQAYQLDSANRTFAQTLSEVYLRSERLQDALRINQRLLSLSPEDDDLRYRLVQLYARTGEMKQALKLTEELQRKFRPSPEAYGQVTQLKIQLLRFTEDKGALEREYRTWAELFPEEREVYYDWLLYLLQEGQGEQVEKQLRQDLASHRITAGDASALRIHRFILEKKYSEAEAELQRLNSDSKLPAREKLTLWLLLVKEAQGSEDYSPSKYFPGVQALLQHYPDDLDILKAYAQLLRYAGEHQKAVDLLYPKTQGHPAEEWIWRELFDNAIELASDSLLHRIATESLPHLPTEWRSYVLLAGDLYTRGEYQAAFTLLEQGAQAIDPQVGFGAARLYGLLADLYAERGGASKAARADSLYLRALEANPKDADVLNNYAYRLAKNGGDIDQAESYAGQAIKLSPDAPHILDTYAYILLLKQNFTLAKLYQRKAVEEAGDKASADMYDHLGDIYLGTGELEEAISAWTRALELNTEGKLNTRLLEKKINDAKKRLKTK